MAQSNIPFWGQAWELVVTYQGPDGSMSTDTISTNSWEPESLRITFDVLQSTIGSPWWYADIVIYNLDRPQIQNTIMNAVSCTLKAGFQTGAARSSIIWDGPVLQVLLDQEDVVDFRATLHCVANPFVMEQIQAFSVGKFTSQNQLVAKMASQIGLPPISQANGTMSAYAEQQLTAVQYPRGNTVFGKTSKYLAQIADHHFMTTYRDGQKAYITELTAGTAVPPVNYVYSPYSPPNSSSTGLPPNTSQSIIGVPRQVPEGVIFTVLLDPRLKVQLPPLVVQLVGTLISQLPRQIGGDSIPLLPLNLTFFVGQVRHIGDSRGNSWYTEVTGYNTTYAAQLLDGNFAADTPQSGT